VKYYRLSVAFILVMLLMSFTALAQEKISVAVAANFASAFKELAMDFEEKTGVKVETAYASTGSLYDQIKSGALYDIFLSADEQRPDLLQKEGWTEGTFIYARGKVILWSASEAFCKAAKWQDALNSDKIKKIAIADYLLDPYGAAAKVALQKAGRWDALQSKLVNTQDVVQSFQYANRSAADAGFCALSVTADPQGKNGCFFIVAEAPDIVQAACMAKKTGNKVNAELFVAYLLCNDALNIRKKYGYR
jgi:molybdate transport system substrate-binding protein